MSKSNKDELDETVDFYYETMVENGKKLSRNTIKYFLMKLLFQSYYCEPIDGLRDTMIRERLFGEMKTFYDNAQKKVPDQMGIQLFECEQYSGKLADLIEKETKDDIPYVEEDLTKSIEQFLAQNEDICIDDVLKEDHMTLYCDFLADLTPHRGASASEIEKGKIKLTY